MLASGQRGDTIIEVLLAVAVFSLVAVGALVVMNRGTNASQRGLEVTLVKQQVDSQAEALRAAQQDYFVTRSNGSSPANNTPAYAWTLARTAGTQTIVASQTACPTNFGDAFAMNGRNATYIRNTSLADSANIVPYAQAKYTSDTVTDPNYTTISRVYGIWITRQTVAGFTPTAYDFTIHACWYGPGSQVPMQIQTIVRLYDAV